MLYRSLIRKYRQLLGHLQEEVVYILSRRLFPALVLCWNVPCYFELLLLNEIHTQMIQHVQWKHLHRGLSFGNLPHIQIHSHLNSFHCFDLRVGSSASLIIALYFQFLSRHLSSVDWDKLRRSLSHAAQIYFDPDRCSVIWEKQAYLGSKRYLSTSIHDRISRLRRPLRDLLEPGYVLLLHAHQNIEPKFASLYLVHALFL